jgi:hypothetical protein
MTPPDGHRVATALLHDALRARGVEPAAVVVARLDDGWSDLAPDRVDAVVCGSEDVDAELFRVAVNRVVLGGWVAATARTCPRSGYERLLLDALVGGWLRLQAQRHVGGGRTAVLARRIAHVPRQHRVIGLDRPAVKTVRLVS